MNLFIELDLQNQMCFDVGANIGKKSEKFLSYGASVVCIEPQKYCVSMLKSRFEKDGRVQIVNCALGSKKDFGSIFISEEHTLSTMSLDFITETSKERFTNTVWKGEETVEILTLDSIIEIHGLPKYCKIDAEGYEVEILKGLSRPIKFISVEFVPELKGKTFEAMSLIDKLGDYKYNYINGESEFFEFENWIDKKEMIGYLEKNNDFKISFGDLYAKLI